MTDSHQRVDDDQPQPEKVPGTPSGTRHVVVVPNSINMVSLLGPGDEHLGLIEATFEADVHVRGNRVTLEGPPAELALIERLLDELVTIIRTGQGPIFYAIKVRAESLPFVLPPKDGAHLKDRFRLALLGPDAVAGKAP